MTASCRKDSTLLYMVIYCVLPEIPWRLRASTASANWNVAISYASRRMAFWLQRRLRSWGEFSRDISLFFMRHGQLWRDFFCSSAYRLRRAVGNRMDALV